MGAPSPDRLVIVQTRKSKLYRSWEDCLLPALAFPPASRCITRCFTISCKLTTLAA